MSTSRLLSSILLGFLILPPTRCQPNLSSKEKPTIIIIGSGAAGIAAAPKLLQNGFDLVVLEAEDRVGGRIKSVPFGKGVVDIGAQWCHGKDNNVVYDLVKDLDILVPEEFEGDYYEFSGSKVEEKLVQNLNKVFDEIYEDEDEAAGDNQSLGEYFVKAFNNTISSDPLLNHTDPNLLNKFLRYFEHSVNSYEGSYSWFEPSAESDYQEDSEGWLLSWNGKGYETILKILMKDIEVNDKIKLNKEVTKVDWKETKVVVECKDGSSYEGNHVIFTPSLGVLKENHKEVFSPALPDDKVKVIEVLGFGAVMKVLLLFSNQWWGQDQEDFSLECLWGDEDKVQLPSNLQQEAAWITELFSFHTVKGVPNVLIGWITGEGVKQAEVVDENKFVETVMFVLTKFFGSDYNISQPEHIIRSKWFNNRHFRGTYSFQTIESRKMPKSAEAILSEPLVYEDGMPKVLFAGEATSQTHYSTVHGAIESGQREADRLISLYK